METMISSEVQRTLVKSPPELWAELSDPAALARHLGEFGDIRITRIQPETSVEWEAERTTGAVHIKASGWGTKVTLTVERELAAGAEAEADAKAGAEAEPESGAEAGADADAGADVEAETEAIPSEATSTIEETEPEMTVGERFASSDGAPLLGAREQFVGEAEMKAQETLEPPSVTVERRRGFFAWLFGRDRHKEAIAASGALDVAPEPEAKAEPEAEATVAHTPEPSSQQEGQEAQAADDDANSVEARAVEARAEALAAEEATAVLTAALDSLGAAHHRPFSRS